MPILFSFLAGIFAVAGWAPLAWWPVALLAYATLAALTMQSRSIRQASSIGLAFGMGLHLAGHGWIYTGLHANAAVPVIPAALSMLAFAGYLALFTAVPCGLWRWLHPLSRPAWPATLAVLSFAFLLTLGEWARSLFFNGFTSLSLGYALIDSWLAGYGPVLGTYGLSAIGFAGSAVMGAWLLPDRRNKALYGLGVVLVLVFGLGLGHALAQVSWVEPAGRPLSYRLLQANVSQQRKFDPAAQNEQIQQYLRAIRQRPADVIVIPETAFPLYLNDLPSETMERMQTFSQASRSHLVLGVATRAANADAYNSMVHVAPDAGLTQYNKVHLMPFGEFSPMGLAWFTEWLTIAFKDLDAGLPDQAPFMVNGQNIGSLICDEDLVGEDMRRWLPGATLLINPSNLAWFESSLAIAQRTQIVRMRALESGRPILRVANTGLTAHIDHSGWVVNQLPIDQAGSLEGRVQPMKGVTPFAYRGDWPVVLSMMLFVLSLALALFARFGAVRLMRPTASKA